MTNRTKIILAIILAFCVYMVIRLVKGKKQNKEDQSSLFKSTMAGLMLKDCDGADGNTPLRHGDVSCEVKALQCHLNHYHGENLTKDGVFGDKTTAALYKHGYKIPVTVNEIGAPQSYNEIIACKY